mmetsp:Transcript_46616/g.144058  ORF Transcript_46616/g.144058 Transcript_46616/m.144058 type:complete len:200 (+) Transcript_46616:244-843(+)
MARASTASTMSITSHHLRLPSPSAPAPAPAAPAAAGAPVVLAAAPPEPPEPLVADAELVELRVVEDVEVVVLLELLVVVDVAVAVDVAVEVLAAVAELDAAPPAPTSSMATGGKSTMPGAVLYRPASSPGAAAPGAAEGEGALLALLALLPPQEVRQGGLGSLEQGLLHLQLLAGHLLGLHRGAGGDVAHRGEAARSAG